MAGRAGGAAAPGGGAGRLRPGPAADTETADPSAGRGRRAGRPGTRSTVRCCCCVAWLLTALVPVLQPRHTSD